MIDLTATIPLLLIVTAYLFLALMVFGLSVNDFVCHFKLGFCCSNNQRWIKSMVAIPLILSCLALLAYGLFAVGMAHGSKPEGYQVVLFILGCLLPIILLIIWIVGSLWLDALWVALIAVLLGYLVFVNPAIYVKYWADGNVQWAQMWMARHYATGQGGLTQSESTARRWYKQAALNGNRDAQYKMASLERRNNEIVKWYRLAAEQGHVGGMVQLARLVGNEEERQRWLKRAADKNHPEALFMLAQNAIKSDLPQARRLLLDAAEKRSRTAIVFLITQYQQGGVLFDKDDALAKRWSAILDKTPLSSLETSSFNTIIIEQNIIQAQTLGESRGFSEKDTLYKQAQSFLHHPAKDQILHDRAINYLTRAADLGHSAAALELAGLAMQATPSKPLNAEALKWYEKAASMNNQIAMEVLAKYYKAQQNADTSDLQKSLEFNERLLDILQTNNNTKELFMRQHWAGEYHDTEKRLAQMKRLGGSWQIAEKQAEESPEKEYLLAKELLEDRQYEAGMQHLKSAAQRDNHQARFELAIKTRRGPRSFTEEINAISDLQALDKLGMLEASLALGSLYQSGTGVVPRNYYLARRLFRKALADSTLSQEALRWLARVPDFTDSLQLEPADDVSGKIEAWYKQMLSQEEDKAVLRQQYETLLDHFGDIDSLKRRAVEEDARAQYQLAQVLQSHDLAQAMVWLQRAATNGDSNAQYELAVRMIRGKKNTPEQETELKKWAIAAGNNGHVGALVFLAVQHENGDGGFEKNRTLTRDFYQKSLNSSDADILFSGKIAGREITIKRSNIQNTLATMKDFQ